MKKISGNLNIEGSVVNIFGFKPLQNLNLLSLCTATIMNGKLHWQMNILN